MPLVPSFSVSQSPSDPGIVLLLNTSTGIDPAITQRRVYIQNSKGEYLVPDGTTTDYVVWNLVDSAIALNVLVNSTAVSIRVDYLNVSNSVIYTSGNTYCLDLFSRNFAYSLIQGLVPPITLSTVYSTSLAQLWTCIISAENAITLASDLVASQAALDRAIYLYQHQNNFF